MSCVCDFWSVKHDLLLGVLDGEVFLLFSREVEESLQGAGVEQVVAALPEDEGQLLVVVGHEGGAWRLLGERDEAVHILDGLVGFLPQLHVDGGVELNQARLQVHGLALGVVQVDGALLVLVLVDMAQMGAQLKHTSNHTVKQGSVRPLYRDLPRVKVVLKFEIAMSVK